MCMETESAQHLPYFYPVELTDSTPGGSLDNDLWKLIQPLGYYHYAIYLLLWSFLSASVMSLHGWHSGERIIRQKLALDHDPSTLMLYMSVDGDLPADHGVFHSTRLPFVPITTLDSGGRPWGSILASGDGRPGFIRNTKYTVLNIDAKVWDGDPIIGNARDFSEGNGMLAAGIGIEFTTRRRNKFAGKLTKLCRTNDTLRIELTVNQALGNCPKYINIRDLVPHPTTSPKIIYNEPHLSPADRLPQELIQLILESDTVFFGSSYHAPPDESHLFPSHLGMNQRGGRPGFIRISPSDGRTVVLPDFSGNRFMTSLGNIESTSLASLTFVSFTTGDILYLTGLAENLCGSDAQALMPFQNTLTTVYVTGYVFVRDALTVRQRAGTLPQPSPYSPPIRLLAEEGTGISTLFKEQEPITALLSGIELHSSTIATFTWETSTTLKILPGQAVILDFTSLLGKQQYQHMAPYRPTSINDDRLRTWTVSRTSTTGKRSFSLTMREKPEGVVTGALFNIALKVAQLKPEILKDARPLGLSVRVAGVTGTFMLPDNETTISNSELGLVVSQASVQLPQPQLLWVAGGIGVTPFLAMLDDLRKTKREKDIHLVLATREPEIFIPMILELVPHDAHHHVTLDLFSNHTTSTYPTHPNVSLKQHAGRIPEAFWDGINVSGDVFVCGPESFEKDIRRALIANGVDSGRIKTEGFEY